jgi:TetR/AcrR family transcriptional regulator
MGAKDRRQRERQLRKKQILDTARDLLFKKGINATTMNQIARNAELSVGTLYLYFKNKEDLYAALQEEGLDVLYDMISEVEAKDLSALQKIREMALAYLDFSEQHRKYYEIINYFLTSPEVVFPPYLKERIDEHGDKILAIIEGVLEHILTGEDKDRKTLHRAAIVFWANIHGMLQFRKLQNTVLKGEDFRELYLHAVSCILRSFGS